MNQIVLYYKSKIKLLKAIRLDILNCSMKYFTSMCITIEEMFDSKNITYDEYLLIKDHMKCNRPKNVHRGVTGHWWPIGLKKPRIKWIDSEIKKIERYIVIARVLQVFFIVILTLLIIELFKQL